MLDSLWDRPELVVGVGQPVSAISVRQDRKRCQAHPIKTDLKLRTGSSGWGASSSAELCLKMTSAMFGMYVPGISRPTTISWSQLTGVRLPGDVEVELSILLELIVSNTARRR